MFSLCCYRRQETFVNLGLFQTTSNYSWFLCLCLVMAFHSILFLYTSSLISKKYRGDTVGSEYSAVDWPLFLFNIHERIDWLNYDCLPKAALTCSGQFGISGTR